MVKRAKLTLGNDSAEPEQEKQPRSSAPEKEAPNEEGDNKIPPLQILLVRNCTQTDWRGAISQRLPGEADSLFY